MISTNAKIISIINNFTNNKLTVSYTVNSVNYTNSIVIPKYYNYKINDNINILYESTNPDYIKFNDINYSFLSMVLIFVGILFMYFFNSFTIDNNKNSKISSVPTNSSNINLRIYNRD